MLIYQHVILRKQYSAYEQIFGILQLCIFCFLKPENPDVEKYSMYHLITILICHVFTWFLSLLKNIVCWIQGSSD